MHVLIWTPPWPVNGNPQFFRNAFDKHLSKQANALLPYASRVSVTLPAHFGEAAAARLETGVEVITLPLTLSRQPRASKRPIYETLYAQPEAALTGKLATQLRPHLPEDVDVVLLWETPAPFLRELYPDALIIHQMPGTFSRPPYPHTVMFDPTGLYRQGLLHQASQDIQTGAHLSAGARQLGQDFAARLKPQMTCFGGVSDTIAAEVAGFEQLTLLPLQVSGHYQFAQDTKFKDQLDLLWAALDQTPPQTGLIVTQYRSGLTSDTPLDASVAATIATQYPQLIYSPTLDRIDSASQYLLPFVDSVTSASSSLALQAMAWHKPLSVLGETYLQGYATDAWARGAQARAALPWGLRCDHTIATLLSRHQPLAQAVTEDGQFLYALLVEMRAKQQAGKTGLEALVDFAQIAPDYAERLLTGFRTERAARALALHAPKGPEAQVLARFQALIDEPDTKAVSFDVFDTLICRSVEKPADLYRFLDQEALDITGGVAADFGKIRTLCEVQTRARLADSHEEITLDDIYDTIAAYYGLEPAELRPLRDAETSLEIAHARARPFGNKLLKIAQASGKPIHLISDMFLPAKVIAKLLQVAGYAEAYDTLHVSSEAGCTKKSGALFRQVLDRLQLPAQALVHVGDNKLTDIKMAQAQGIRAFRWSAAIEWQRENPVLKKIYPPRRGAGERARSALAGTTARGLFDAPCTAAELASLSGGDAYRFGYAALGPLLAGYMLWLGREAERDGIKDLYFMAREGFVLRQVFDALHPEQSTPARTQYLLGSRRAIRVAACRDRADILALLAEPYDIGVPLAVLFEGRFGLRFAQEDLPRLHVLGVTDLQMPLERSFAHQKLLIAVADAVLARLLKQAAAERESYMAYLGAQGYLAASQAAIVDLGWKANIQGALGQLTGKASVGYYYATVQDSLRWRSAGGRHRAYFADALSAAMSRSVAVQNRHLLEFMLCHSARSLTAIRHEGGQFHPVFQPEGNLLARRRLIDPLHRGAVAFAKTLQDGFGDQLDQIVIDPDLAERAIAEVINAPQPEDARIFQGQSFSDAVGGLPEKFIVAPNAAGRPAASVWQQGAAALRAQPKHRKATALSAAPRAPFPRLEALCVRLMVNDRKRAKYDRDRGRFFADSHSRLAGLYWTAIDRPTAHQPSEHAQ